MSKMILVMRQTFSALSSYIPLWANSSGVRLELRYSPFFSKYKFLFQHVVYSPFFQNIKFLFQHVVRELMVALNQNSYGFRHRFLKHIHLLIRASKELKVPFNFCNFLFRLTFLSALFPPLQWDANLFGFIPKFSR